MFNSPESAEKSAFLFEQVREIYALLQPVSKSNAARTSRSGVRWMVVLGVALVATLLTVLIAARNPFPTWPLIGLEVLTLALLSLYGYFSFRQDLQEWRTVDRDAHAALRDRSDREAVLAARLLEFNKDALTYVLAEYDSNLEAVERASGFILGPARAGGITGLAALLLSTFLGAYRSTGLWVLGTLLILGAFTAGGFMGFRGFEGQRRTRALLARVVTLKTD